MVFAEVMGKKKNSTKHNKAKDQPDNDRYLFKRRDEPNELKIPQTGQKTSSLRPSLVDASLELATGDYVLQKRAPALSPKQQIPVKHEQMFTTEMNSPSTSGRVTTIEDKPVAPRFTVIDHTSPLLEPNSSKSVDGFQQPPNFAAKVEQTHGLDVKFQGQDSRFRTETGGKKTKLVKRPAGESVAEKSSLGEKKKKRKKELGMEMSMQKKAFTGNARPPPREDIRIEHQKKDNGGSSLFRDSLGPPPGTIGLGKLELKLPQLLDGLQALALNPFCGMESNSPAIIRQAFLNFRSLVYQKSLAMSSSSEMQSHEVPPPENVKDLPTVKPQKPLVRPADTTKGGHKRVPSDRLEEMSAKRVKKINDIKSLAIEKKATERNLESRRDAKETMDSRRAKWFKPDPMKKKESLAKVREPTTLVMKFPPNTTLPAGFELKARLARFGPLDHSRTRTLWKSSQVHVVFIHRADAEAAHRHLMGRNTLFGNVDMRCSIRPLEATAPESETKVQREDGPMETPHLRDSRAEQRPTSAMQLKSCLKKQVGDEAAAVAASGSNGVGGRGAPRVKFVLGVAEGSSGGEEMMASNNHFNSNEAVATGGSRVFPRVKFMSGGEENLMDTSKNILNNASFADGASSSISHGMDFSSQNFQKGNLPPLLPLPPQFQNAPTNLRYAETTHRTTTHNLNARPSSNYVDIAPEMLSLLAKCNDVVTNLVCNLGFLPYHPL